MDPGLDTALTHGSSLLPVVYVLCPLSPPTVTTRRVPQPYSLFHWWTLFAYAIDRDNMNLRVDHLSSLGVKKHRKTESTQTQTHDQEVGAVVTNRPGIHERWSTRMIGRASTKVNKNIDPGRQRLDQEGIKYKRQIVLYHKSSAINTLNSNTHAHPTTQTPQEPSYAP